MAVEIKVPTLGESVTEATVGQWFKKPGEAVNADEPVVELETDKVTVEVPAPATGVLADIKVPPGVTVAVGSVLGSISEGNTGPRKSPPPKAAARPSSDTAPTRLVSPRPAPAPRPAPERAPPAAAAEPEAPA